MFRLDSGHVYRAEALEQFTWLNHGFGTRLSSDWPDTRNLATIKQVHSDRVLTVETAGPAGEGDALISNRPGLSLAIRTADCLPILMVDPRNRAIAAVHAGWRGTAAEITAKAIDAMAREFGTRSEELIIAIGPGIGACCYMVGPEVTARFRQFFPEREDLSGAAKIDLVQTTIRQLRRNGGKIGQIAPATLCTHCQSELFHSYRRDGEAAGRMVTTIGLQESSR